MNSTNPSFSVLVPRAGLESSCKSVSRWVICGAVGLFIAGCGGGSAPVSQPLATCAPLASVVVQIEGDSISTGSGTTDIAWSPEYMLRVALLKRWPVGVSVVMTGISGTTTQHRMLGEHGFAKFPAAITGQVYVPWWGVNDARQSMPLADYRANIERLAAVPGVVLMTPTPIDASVPLSYGKSTADYAQVVRDVAASSRVPMADPQAVVLGLSNWQVMLPDGVHPNDALYRILADRAIIPAVVARVAALRCE